MAYVPWNSQPLDEWAREHAPGRFVDLSGHSTHYVEQGEGAPVILIHGFFYDTFMWHENIDALASVFKVYAFDLWGFGYSTREPMDYGYPLYCRQLLKFMDALGIRKASLIGQSMGGGTIVQFANVHRDRVEKVILVDAAGMPNPLPLMGKIASLPLVGELMYGLPGGFMRRFVLRKNFIYDPQYITSSYFENVTRFHKIKGSSEAMLTVLRKQFFHTLLDEIHSYGQLNVPTLIVWGRQDPNIPLDRGEAMHTILPGSRFEVIDQAGHCPNDEQSGVFNQLAIDFLSSANSRPV
jgi:pimeloyl-ACP methyl ester carboxylesterase